MVDGERGLRGGRRRWAIVGASVLALVIAGCSGGGDSEDAGGAGVVPSPAPGAGPSPSPGPAPVTTQTANFPETPEAAQFLTMATFGPTEADVEHLTQVGYSAWFREQFNLPITPIASTLNGDADFNDTLNGWWNNTVYGQDQLRQRMAFALSQIFVASGEGQLGGRGQVMARYMDIMQEGAFGTYRQVLGDVTYSPAMGIYLTYLGNEKANPNTGSVPDENYSREVMQLFSIGLLELNRDGTLRLDPQQQPIETYDNEDIEELAKVFTGLWWNGLDFRRQGGQVTPQIELQPMQMNEEAHSDAQKSFLDLTIPAGTSGADSVDQALDHLADHPNVAPFISQLLIQRFVKSNPSAAYTDRVAVAFETGAYELPDGTMIGSGERGDFRAVLPAILLDREALDVSTDFDPVAGKIREPVVRFAHWARLFDINSANADEYGYVRDLSRSDRLNQQPYKSRSVFNFYRPGYVAPGTETAAAGLVAPELQIWDSNSAIGYANFMQTLVTRTSQDGPFTPNYDDELALLADDPDRLIEHVRVYLLGGRMRDETRARMLEAMAFITNNDPDLEALRKVQAVVLLAVTSPEFIVQY